MATRYSSHIQLQYLLQKYNIDHKHLQKELEQYYSHPAFIQHKTKSGKVTKIQHREELVPPKINKPKKELAYTSQPKVTIKKRRNLLK